MRNSGAIAAESVFVQHRDLLFTVAYEMLGTAADAEDVVQESWLRWAGVDQSTLHDPRAYLVRIVTRQALNRLRTVKRRREEYIGPWLPEPLMTTGDVADDAELAESVSLAMLVVLETLAPAERAVFVLREVFGFDYDEIAEAVGKTNAAVRQMAHRAREHVRARRPQTTVTKNDHARVCEQFFEAAMGGDVQLLMNVLAPGVVLLTDGGGNVRAALNPIVSADRVIRFLDGVRPEPEGLRIETAWVNGSRSLLVYINDVLDTVVSAHVENEVITELYVMRNPEKLTRLQQTTLRLVR